MRVCASMFFGSRVDEMVKAGYSSSLRMVTVMSSVQLRLCTITLSTAYPPTMVLNWGRVVGLIVSSGCRFGSLAEPLSDRLTKSCVASGLSTKSMALCAPDAVGLYHSFTCSSAAVTTVFSNANISAFAPVIDKEIGCVRFPCRMVSVAISFSSLTCAVTAFIFSGKTVNHGVALSVRFRLNPSKITFAPFFTATLTVK